MREIKFRAWDKRIKMFIPIMQFIDDLKNAKFRILGKELVTNAFDIQNLKVLLTSEDVELMQYVGLKDVNGKEIYEGDILKCKLNNGEYENYLVEWIEENCSFEAWNKDKSNFMDCTIWNDFEIIGNIFEDNKLLEEKLI